jgi:hypothetical protein
LSTNQSSVKGNEPQPQAVPPLAYSAAGARRSVDSKLAPDGISQFDSKSI